MTTSSYLRAILLVSVCLSAPACYAMTLAPDQHTAAILKTTGVIEAVNRQAGTLVIRHSDATGALRRTTVRVPDTGLLDTPLNQPFRFVAESQNGEMVLLAILPPK